AVLDDPGRPARLVGVNVDVTGERRREEGLRELAGDLQTAVEASERERNRIYDLSNDLFAVVGFDGFLKTINPAWERLLGYSRAELLAKPLAAVIHPDDLAAAGQVIAALQTRDPLQRFENRLITADNNTIWVAWAAVPEGDRFYAVGRDVSREREQDEALRQSRSEEHTSELQSHLNLVCRLLLEKKNYTADLPPQALPQSHRHFRGVITAPRNLL